MIGKQILHYKILEEIGRGGMGVVYKAEDTRLKRQVALKFLPRQIAANAEEHQRFKNEAQAAAALNHPNICTIYAIEDVGEEMFLVMEYIEGRELRDIIREHPDTYLPVDRIVDYATQIAAGLRAAHKKDIVHRDIKSSNIMISDDGQLKIMDFGLAKSTSQTAVTREGATIGTVAYMAPEQCLGEMVDHRADLWSFGVVLYEMLTGELPFRSDVDQVVIYQILNEPPQPVSRPDIPDALATLLEKTLAKDRDERCQSAGELIDGLRIVTGSPDKQLVVSISKARSSWRPAGKHWLFVAATLIGLLLIILGYAGWHRSRPASQAGRNSIAVMYFDNRSREPDLDKIMVDMLTTNLARHRYLEVLSSQRLYDILKKLDRLDEQRIDRAVATEIANNAGVKTMLLGSIVQLGNKIRINSQLTDVKTGNIIGSELVEGERIEDIFSMVDVLTAKLSLRLDVVASDKEGEILRVADATTKSYEAYKAYLKGRESSWRREFAKAQAHFRDAIAVDSTFALAYLYLARAGNNTIDPLLDLSHVQYLLQQAERYSGGTSKKEQLLISSYKAFYERNFPLADSLFQAYARQYPNDLEAWVIVAARYLGKADEAIRMLKRQLEVDPSFAPPYNELAYCYSQQGEHTKAISSVKKYMALLPDISNAYDSAWDIYTQAGRHEEALRICQTALETNPDWGSEIYLLIGYTLLFQGNGELARQNMLKTLNVDASQQAWVTKNIGFTYVYEGRYHKAADEFELAAEQALHSGQNVEALRTYLELARLLIARGDFAGAGAVASRAREFSGEIYRSGFNPAQILCDYTNGMALIRQGKNAEAESTAAAIQSFVLENHYDIYYLHYCELLRAELALAAGNSSEALAALAKAPAMFHYYPRHHVLRAKSYALSGDIDRAIQIYEHLRYLVDTQLYYMAGDAFDHFWVNATIDYEIGRLYEKQGDLAKMAEHFSRFLKQWQDADIDLPEVAYARERLAEAGVLN